MPFKTRKHKTAAGERRITYSENAIKYQSGSLDLDPHKNIKIIKVNDLGSRNDYFYVRGDLVKIIIISALIVGIQITLAVLKFPHA